MIYNKLAIIPLCILGGLVFIVVGVLLLGAREPLTLALEAANEQAQADNADAQADLANARAVEAGAEADLVQARGIADALETVVDGAMGILRWVAIAAPLSAPAYIGCGVTLGLCIGVPSGALWILDREHKRASEAHRG